MDRAYDANLVVGIHKELNKVVAIVGRWFKTYDEAITTKRIEYLNQQMEAIIVISEYEQLKQGFTI